MKCSCNNCTIITVLMSFSAHYNICVNSDLFSTDRFFPFVVFLCFFAHLVVQVWMPDIRTLACLLATFVANMRLLL